MDRQNRQEKTPQKLSAYRRVAMIRRIIAKVMMTLSVFSLAAADENWIDLEDKSQDFILETKKIEIPGYSVPFNPSIIRWRGQLLLSFRIIPDLAHKYNGEIGLVFLNEDFEVASEPQLVCLRDEYAKAPCRAEDARLIAIDDHLFMVYDDNAEIKLSKGGFRVYVAELDYDGEHFIAGNIECLSSYEGESREIREKAWVPFNYQGHLLLAYSILPHKIFYPRLDGSGICDTIAVSTSPIQWDWGILRGGTPGILDNDQYLAFFHSSKNMATVHSNGENILHYFLGAYTFSKEPPFEVTSISPEPIVGRNFYHGITYKGYWKPVCCIFPCGYVSSENFIWVAYGRDDHECWIAKIDKKRLLESLVPTL